MQKRSFVLIVAQLLTFGLGTHVIAQEANTPKLISAQAIADITDTSSAARSLALSPDGKTIAWLDNQGQQICLIALADATNICYPYDEDLRGTGRYSAIAWSPDSRYIATNESFFDYLVDSDIWIFDTRTGTFQDRTDDQFFGNALKMTKTAVADYLPTWNPVTGDLYIFRTPAWMGQNSSGGPETNLYKLPVEAGEPTLLQMLAVRLPPLSVYRPVSVSPDGKQMAFLGLPNDYLKNPATGLWVMNLVDVTFTQIAALADFQSGLPSGAVDSTRIALVPNTVYWAGNRAVVVSMKDTQAAGEIPQNSYYVDVSSGDVKPLLDFSTVSSGVDYFKQPTDGRLAPAAKSPRAGIVTPDGTGFVYLSTDVPPKTAYVWWAALPPTEAQPALIGTIEDFKITPAADAEPGISADGKEAVLYGYLLKLG